MKRVAILGKLPSKYNAPFKNIEYDIWTMNLHRDHNKLPRITTCFDLHKIPQNPNADILRKDFPFDKCKELVGGNYFNNSVSYLIAYAILQEYEEIRLYGMRFLCDHERRHGEYTNVQSLICFAKGKGILINAPADKVMLKGIQEILSHNGNKGSKIINIVGNYGNSNIEGIKTNNIIKTCLKYINDCREIHLYNVQRSYSQLIMYGKALGINIINHDNPYEPFPDYNYIQGKDFDAY